ncbi:MAG: hypothetical protein DWQ07_12745 [Chloroflexi bacterium]|nr:MAG: hypothetical protein DWQ07_12745 [Chloroflexota bacterium]MBL1196907.1 hypothetical protein [Chloroflexota bacterium]NOH14203.1 hypothetical protein [Chloroflexota bacterium]
MAELLEVIDRIRAEDAGVKKLFTPADGVGVRGLSVRMRARNPQYMAKLAETARFMADLYTGKRPAHHLQEALTTDDFPILFGDVLDRQLLANYREAPYSWNTIVRRRRVRDFRTVKRFFVDGGDGTLPEVGRQEEYPETKLDDGKYEYSVTKRGRRMPFAWETMVNDDLDALNDVPERFGKAARRSEEKEVTELFIDANGPHASFFTGGNNNLIPSNPVLSTNALQTGLITLAAQKDAGGEPIVIEAVTLWVPPALEITAMNIVNALQLELNEAGGSTNTKLITANWVKNRVKVSVGHYIPIVAATANGATTWMLFADPENSGRPAGEIGFLRGHEEPEIFLKAPNAMRVGSGGQVDPMAGDFDTDSINYKVRHVMGSTRMDPKMAVASNGSGA